MAYHSTKKTTLHSYVREYFRGGARAHQEFLSRYTDEIEAVGKLLVDAVLADHTVFFCGNGGSAADAQHLAAEFVGKFQGERRPLKGMALHTNTSALTAIANDYGWEEVFSRQVEAWSAPGDFLVAISTSGNSTNVIKAVRMASHLGVFTIGLLGGSGGRLRQLVDYPFIVPSNETPHIQEVHITLGHLWCGMVDLAVKKDANRTLTDNLSLSPRSGLSPRVSRLGRG